VLVRVHACGICRTDLHVIDGELPPRISPVIPGHQVVGVVEHSGTESSLYSQEARAELHGSIAPARFVNSAAPAGRTSASVRIAPAIRCTVDSPSM
jgi:NADPH:quinone reductase-like Zn-dependent oxidoreductase